MELNNIIKEIAKNAAKPLHNVSEIGVKAIKEFEIECSLLDDYNYEDIRESKNFKNLFNDLKKIEGPVLYYWEVTSDHSPYEIVERIKKYANSENSKSIPAIKRNYPQTKILYVGKVKKHIWGRFVQHLGFYKVQRTQGLQLFYWAKELCLDLKVTVLEFEPDMINLMDVLEREMAKELKPILGKHR
ncbi:hypothetical protein [Flavobacterium anhuiense]|uniref:hypothetical protein n=1 Tax=Flavobacterium anhuiense TaxID=459526 RepID=UPI002026375F|nr:hypothetical protein [Flavobacterium anhuiense]URM36296.1 hypothetical protein LLY39_18020 [Flavobacterium anhuiense]